MSKTKPSKAMINRMARIRKHMTKVAELCDNYLGAYEMRDHSSMLYAMNDIVVEYAKINKEMILK